MRSTKGTQKNVPGTLMKWYANENSFRLTAEAKRREERKIFILLVLREVNMNKLNTQFSEDSHTHHSLRFNHLAAWNIVVVWKARRNCYRSINKARATNISQQEPAQDNKNDEYEKNCDNLNPCEEDSRFRFPPPSMRKFVVEILKWYESVSRSHKPVYGCGSARNRWK